MGQRINISAFLLLLSGFVLAFWQPWVSALPENDMWWMFPTLTHSVQGKPFGEVLGFLLGPWPKTFGDSILKVYLYVVTGLFGMQAKPLIAVALLFHWLNAALLYRVCRLLKLSQRVAFSASLLYATAFIHFHAFFFPSNFRHVFAVFTILWLFQSYLQTEQKMCAAASGARGSFYGTLLLGVLASVQRSAIIAPLILLSHLLLTAADRQERRLRTDRWMPFFMVYMLYPTFSMAFVGDVIVNDVIVRLPYSAGLKWAVLLALGLAGLLGVRWMVGAAGKGLLRGRWLWFVGLGCLAAVWCWVASQDRRQILLPYNAFSPFLTCLAAFLDPLSAARQIDAAQAHQYLPALLSLWNLLFSVMLLWLFWAAFLRHKPQLWILAVWYGVALVHLLHHYANFPPSVPSRYFLYVTPIFAVIFGSGLVCCTGWLVRRMRIGRAGWNGVVAALLVVMALPNLAAVPVAVFRGKLANTYMLYDDVRTAELIRDDLAASRRFSKLSSDAVLIQGVVEMPHRVMAREHSLADPYRYENFRWEMEQALASASTRRIRINETPEVSTERIYRINRTQVVDDQGRSIDPFDRWMELGFGHLEAGRREEALRSFRQALQVRPYLLRYLLGSLKLSDARWIAGGMGLRDWVEKVSNDYARMGSKPHRKKERIRAILDREIWDTITGFFLVSYLLEREGESEASRGWLAQIRFLEPDPEVLIRHLSQHPQIRNQVELRQRLNVLRNPLYFYEPLPWRKDDYGFGRFLLRLLVAWHVPSGWERTPEMSF